MAKFEIYKDNAEKFRFRLKAGNGQVILASQGYAAKSGAQGGIESVKKNSQDDARFERKTSKSDEPYFVLKAGNGEVIAQSQMYSSTSAMETGIASVTTNAPIAETDDQA